MKKILLAVLTGLLGWSAAAQNVPDRLNYQAVLTDAHGLPQVHTTNIICFRIYDEAEGGNLIWGEKHSVTTSPRGLFNVVLGKGFSLGEQTDAAHLRDAFASGTQVEQRYLELQALNADGSAQSPIMPRQRFLTVPYAFQANDGQNAAGNFRVAGALYANQTGMDVNRMIVTNTWTPVTVAGDLRVDGYGKSSVTVSFNSNVTVRSSAPEALVVNGDLTVNQTLTIGGTGTFYGGISASAPNFHKGATVKGGIRALGAYQLIGKNLTNNLSARTAPGDGFVLVYFKTDYFSDNSDLVIAVGSMQFRMQHWLQTEKNRHSVSFKDTSCIPVNKGLSWSIYFDPSDRDAHDHASYDVYWIPFGY